MKKAAALLKKLGKSGVQKSPPKAPPVPEVAEPDTPPKKSRVRGPPMNFDEGNVTLSVFYSSNF